MPAAEKYATKRGGPLLTATFWVGMGLAPLAALLLLMSQGAGAVKIAAVLAIIAVICIGLSLVLRRDADTIRVELEEAMLDELDTMRDEVSASTRASHRALTERIRQLQQTVENLRGQLDAQVGVIPAISHGHAAGMQTRGPGGPGLVRHTETVVTTRSTIVDDDHDQPGRGAPGRRPSRRPPEEWDSRRPTPAARPDDGYQRSGERWASVRADDHGRELVMGERRRAVRRDAHGTEMHVEDRWGTMRRDDGRGRYPDAEAESGFWSDDWDAEPGDQPRKSTRRRALPSSPHEPEERWSSYEGRPRRVYDEDRYDRR